MRLNSRAKFENNWLSLKDLIVETYKLMNKEYFN